jgi:hypothetical protein
LFARNKRNEGLTEEQFAPRGSGATATIEGQQYISEDDALDWILTAVTSPEVAIVAINPPTAEQLLNSEFTAVTNRAKSDPHVAKLRRDMETGRWYLICQGMSIDRNGNFMDGQHRLQAIVDSGVTIETSVMRGVDPAAVSAIDETRKRTFPDDMKIFGEKDYSPKAAIVRLLRKATFGWERGLSFSTTMSLSFNRYELWDFYEDLKDAGVDIQTAIRVGARIRKSHQIVASGIGAAHVLSQVNYGKDFTDHFFYRLHENDGLEKGEPLHSLAKRFKSEAGRTDKPDSAMYLAWTLKALNYAYLGKSVTSIEFKGRVPSHLPEL